MSEVKKLSDGAVVERCRDCEHIIGDQEQDLDNRPVGKPYYQCANQEMIDGAFPEVNPYTIHRDCKLRDVEVVDCKQLNLRLTMTPKVVPNTRTDGAVSTFYEDIEQILIVRKGDK